MDIFQDLSLWCDKDPFKSMFSSLVNPISGHKHMKHLSLRRCPPFTVAWCLCLEWKYPNQYFCCFRQAVKCDVVLKPCSLGFCCHWHSLTVFSAVLSASKGVLIWFCTHVYVFLNVVTFVLSRYRLTNNNTVKTLCSSVMDCAGLTLSCPMLTIKMVKENR